ncbi:MAG: cytochrome c oxidase subunit II [Oligoflexia bacterium]|nr:cytochrome c oxidase subunit II [Oligoflexia bacterium]
MMEQIITQASSYAAQIDNVIHLIAAIVGVWLAVAFYVFFSFIFKYTRKRHPKAAYITGETHEDGKWVHRAHFVVIACDVVILVFAAMAWHHVKQQLPPAEATIRIVGQQWAWKFTDPGLDNQLDTVDDINTIDELHVKVNTVYHFKLEAKDVLHSFSVPVFRLKQDAIPGRVITGWFKPTKTGEYDIQCAEMCGIGHGVMAAKIVVETPEAHAAWLEQHKSQNITQNIKTKNLKKLAINK